MKTNIIMVFHKDRSHILMCRRMKEPYKGLYNLVGGKVEPNECGIDSAYRELEEETGITKEMLTLHHFMTFHYALHNFELEVYVGYLEIDVNVQEEANPLAWISTESNFFDTSIYAGEGNIGHIIAQIKKAEEFKKYR